MMEPGSASAAYYFRGPCVAKVDDLVCIGMAVSMGGVGFAPPTVLSKNCRRSETYASHRNCHTDTYKVVNLKEL